MPKISPKTESKPPIEIVGYQEDANLREVGWNQKFLDGVKKEWKLAHRQAVLFINAAHDRFRLVVCFYGWAVLMLPPIDPQDRISLYLKISEFLRKFSRHGVTPMFDTEIENTKSRIERRELMAVQALDGRKKVR